VPRLTGKQGFCRTVLLSAAVLGRRDSYMFTENVCQVGLTRKSTLSGNLNNRHLPEFQKGLSMLDSSVKDIPMGCDACRGAKHFKEVSSTIARFLRQRD